MITFERVLSGLLLLVCLCLGAHAQDTEPDLLIGEATELFLNGRVSEAIARFQELADQYQGTDHGRIVLEFLGKNSPNAEEQRAALRRIIEDFPDTRFETDAKLHLVTLAFLDSYDREVHRDACSDLAMQLGGPSYEMLVDPEQYQDSIAAIRDLERDKQERLLRVYGEMWSKTLMAFPTAIEGDAGDRATALKIVRFLRQAFEPLNIGYDGFAAIRYCLGSEVRSAYGGQEFVDPTVSFSSPSGGDQTGPFPTVRAQIVVGDLEKHQMALDSLRATLDGVDVTGALNIQLSYGEILPNEVYETVSVDFTPTSPLSVGPHEFMIEGSVSGYTGEGPGRAAATLEFLVRAAGPTAPPRGDLKSSGHVEGSR